MERSDLSEILKKLDIKEEDIFSISENWPQMNVNIQGLPQVVKSNVKYYEINTKDGRQYFLNLHRLTKIIKTSDERGFDFLS